MEKQQMEAAFRVSNLIFKHLSGTISQEEQSEITAWIEYDQNNKALFELLTTTNHFHDLLNEFYKIEAGKKNARKKMKRRLFTYKAKILELTARVWKYVA